MISTTPPLLAEICAVAANAVDAQASVAEHPDRYVVTFGRAGSDETATLTVQKQLFADAIEWGERRIRAELEHEAAKVCAALRPPIVHRCPVHGTENFCNDQSWSADGVLPDEYPTRETLAEALRDQRGLTIDEVDVSTAKCGWTP